MMEESDLQSLVEQFEDELLTLAHYISDRQLICSEYRPTMWFIHVLNGLTSHAYKRCRLSS